MATSFKELNACHAVSTRHEYEDLFLYCLCSRLYRLGFRQLEAVFGTLIAIEAVAMGTNFIQAGIPSAEVAKGTFVPTVRRRTRVAACGHADAQHVASIQLECGQHAPVKMQNPSDILSCMHLDGIMCDRPSLILALVVHS